MFKDEVLNVRQSESNVPRNLVHRVTQRMFAGTRTERQVECGAGEKCKYGFVSECAVLWGNIASKWPP